MMLQGTQWRVRRSKEVFFGETPGHAVACPYDCERANDD